MFFVIDNGESYSDHSLYFVRVLPELDSEANNLEALLMGVYPPSGFCLFRAEHIEWRSSGSWAEFWDFLEPWRLFTIVNEGYSGLTYKLEFLTPTQRKGDYLLIPNEDMWGKTTPVVLDHLLKAWDQPEKNSYLRAHLPFILREAEKRWGHDWRKASDPGADVNRFDRDLGL